MGHLAIRLTNPDPDPADVGSPIRVVIRDTSESDALHPTVLETSAVADDSGEYEVVLDVPEGALQPDRRYSLWAHLSPARRSEMKTGDLITTQNIPVTAQDAQTGADIHATLTRI